LADGRVSKPQTPRQITPFGSGPSPPAEITVEDLTDTGVRVQVGATIQVAADDTAQDYLGVGSDLREQIAERIESEGIRLAELPLTCLRWPEQPRGSVDEDR